MAESYITRKGGGGGAKINEAFQSFVVASGQTITAGTFVNYLQGTLSLSGSASLFNDGTTSKISTVALSIDKIAVIYKDFGNSGRGTAIIGTINGSIITWGNEYIFDNTEIDDTSVTSLGNNKIVVFYKAQSNSNRGTVIIGSVDGTVITWGSPSIVKTDATNYPSIITLDSDKVAVVYHSSLGYGRIGTISGTNISWGTEAVYTFGGSNYNVVVSLTSSKIVVGYSDSGNSNKGTVVVGTISGTSISWGSKINYTPSFAFFTQIVSLDENKIMVAFQDGSGRAAIGTVDGTNVFFGSSYTFNPASTSEIYLEALTPDSVVVIYTDGGNANYGTASLGKINGTIISWGSEIVYNSATTYNMKFTSLGVDKIAVFYQNGSNSNKGTVKIGTIPISIINTSDLKVFGLAKTGGTAGQTIEVYTNS